MYDIFEDPDNLIEWKDFVENPASLLNNPNLVVCLEGEIYKY